MLNHFDRERLIWNCTLKPSEKIVLLALNSFVDAEGKCFPGCDKLAQMTGYDRSTLFRILKNLYKSKLVTKHERRTQKGSWSSNLYRIDFTMLQSTMLQNTTPQNATPTMMQNATRVERENEGLSDPPCCNLRHDLSRSLNTNLSIQKEDLSTRTREESPPSQDLNFGQEIQTQQNEFQQPALQHPVAHTEPISDPLPQNAITVGDGWKVPPGFSLSENEIKALFSVDPIENLSAPAITDPWIGGSLKSHPDAYPWTKFGDRRELAQAWHKYFVNSFPSESMAIAILRKGTYAYPGSKDYRQVHDIWCKWVADGKSMAAAGSKGAINYSDPKIARVVQSLLKLGYPMSEIEKSLTLPAPMEVAYAS